MSKNRYVNTHFWKDSFINELDPSEKLLFLYFLTNPQTDICGAYEIRLKEVALDTGFEVDMVKKILIRFEQAGKIFYRDGWVYISKFIKHQKLNPNIEKGIAAAVNDCPDWIKQRIWLDYGKPSKGFERLSKALNYLNTNLNLNTNTNGKSESVCETEINPEENKFVNETIAGIKKRLRVTFSLPDEPIWQQSATWAFVNGYTPEQFLACYDHLKSQKWREGRLTPDTVKKNLPEYALGNGKSEPITFHGKPLK